MKTRRSLLPLLALAAAVVPSASGHAPAVERLYVLGERGIADLRWLPGEGPGMLLAVAGDRLTEVFSGRSIQHGVWEERLGKRDPLPDRVFLKVDPQGRYAAVVNRYRSPTAAAIIDLQAFRVVERLEQVVDVGWAQGRLVAIRTHWGDPPAVPRAEWTVDGELIQGPEWTQANAISEDGRVIFALLLEPDERGSTWLSGWLLLHLADDATAVARTTRFDEWPPDQRLDPHWAADTVSWNEDLQAAALSIGLSPDRPVLYTVDREGRATDRYADLLDDRWRLTGPPRWVGDRILARRTRGRDTHPLIPLRPGGETRLVEWREAELLFLDARGRNPHRLVASTRRLTAGDLSPTGRSFAFALHRRVPELSADRWVVQAEEFVDRAAAAGEPPRLLAAPR